MKQKLVFIIINQQKYSKLLYIFINSALKDLNLLIK